MWSRRRGRSRHSSRFTGGRHRRPITGQGRAGSSLENGPGALIAWYRPLKRLPSPTRRARCSSTGVPMRWPFETLTVGSFRGLRETKLEGLGRVNLLVGGSNSGKTSVLEAISLLSSPTDPLVWLHAANRREPSPLAALTSSNVDRIRYLFPVDLDREQSIVKSIRIDVSGSSEIDSVVASLSELRGMRPQRDLFETGEGGANEVIAEVERSGLEIAVQA